ncbi:glycosyltransferase family 2 protein [Robertmurraya sp. Marseille-Q9965]
MLTISLVMIVKNEENNIGTCLSSVSKHVDEIIVVDTGSTDKTKEIAKKYGAILYDYEWANDFAAARNFALSKSTSKWNLILDADEQIVKWNKEGVKKLLQKEEFIGKICIKNKFLQNNEDRLSQTLISRLIPRGVAYQGRIHEQVVSDLPRLDLPIEVLHTGYYETDKSERNITLLTEELKSNSNKGYIHYQMARQYKTMNLNEEAEAFFKEAYRLSDPSDGYLTDLVVNYIYTLIELKRFYPAFEIIDQMNVPLGNSPDFNFVTGLFYMHFVLSDTERNIDFLPLIERSYLICIALGQQNQSEIVLGTGSFLAAYNLAIYYEMFNQKEKAKEYYKLSATYDYAPAKMRLMTLFQ